MNIQKFTTFKTILIALVLIINANQLFAQTTNGIFFQAVARDNFSNPAKDRKIYVQSSIIQTTPTGTKVLTEEHQANTDATGVFSISLGNGVRVGGTANSLGTIDWSKGPFYLNLKVAITPVGGNSSWDYNKEWVDMGTTSFGAVPFALYSASSAKVDDKLNVSDTTTMLKVYAKAIKVQSLETAVASKLTAADTLTMLAPYAKAAYTIDSSFFKLQLATKLSIADSAKYVTATQLASYNFSSSGTNTTTTTTTSVTMDTTSLSNRINLKASTSDLTTLNRSITSNTASITANATAINLKASIASPLFTGTVGIGTTNPSSAAALDITSTSQGLLLPRLTYLQKTAISNPVAGLILFCSDCGSNGEMQLYNGTSFVNMIGATAQFALPVISSTTGAYSITTSSAISGGVISSDGGASITDRGLVWGISAGSSTYNVTTGTGTGTFTSSITGLTSGITYYIRAYATNSIGTRYGPEITLNTVQAVPTLAATTTVSSIGATIATSGGNITYNGGAVVITSGVVWSTTSTPTIALTTKTTDGAASGTYTSNITGLTPGTLYYVSSYATNSVGTSYGAQTSFTTLNTATISATASATSITSTTANSGATITSDGGAVVTARGLVYGLTTGSSTFSVTTGTGTGTYTSSLTGLSPATTYYVRSFATNSVGTVYGTETNFATLAIAPSLTTTVASSITKYAASAGGTITSNGGSIITASGICWSTTATPTISDSKTTDGASSGTYTSSLTGLTAGTTYYVRAYATNAIGTSYGAALSFTTLSTLTLPTLPTVGSSYGGGVVAYVYQAGDPGYTSINIPVLITGNDILGFTRWYNGSNTTTGATATALGTGSANTNSIIANQGASTGGFIYAAALAKAYNGGGFTDWYLPSQDELNKLFLNKVAIGGFDGTMNYFWTSTELSASNVVLQNFLLDNTTLLNFPKSATGGTVRAVRTVTLAPSNNPTLAITTSATNITSNSAILGGNVTDEGATQVSTRGLVYGTTTGSSTYSVTVGSGAGTFSSTLTSLAQGTTYYVRSFATNVQGTGYGAETSFTTQTTATVSVTATPTSITTTTAIGGGTISSNGGATITTSGLVWDASVNPTIALSTKTTDGTTSGTFTSSITGLIQGTSYHVRAYATNYLGTTYGPDITFTTLNTATISATASATSITSSTATSGGTITLDGGAAVTSRGLVYGIITGSSTYSVTTGTGTGTYTISLTGLSVATTYFVRAFATNSVGTVYGPETNFTTLAVVPTLASTETVTSVTTTTAISGGNITNNGGATVTTSGLVWSTTTNPTIPSATKTTDGTSTGIFTSSLTGLTAATTYYLRSYATNSVGTNYGTQTSFTTLAQAPTVSATAIPTSIARTTAVVGGTVSVNGIPSATRGLVYGTSSGSSTYSVTVGSGAGTYSTSISGLSAGTTYFVRAFASNSLGTVYGPEQTFITVAAFSAPLIVTSGLLLNLDAANPDSYSGSGTTWTNLAPTGSSSVPNFTINSSATYNSGIGAINLNSGSTAIASTTSSFGLLSSFTMEVWVKVSSTSQGGSLFTERIRNPITNQYATGAPVNMSLSYNYDYLGNVSGGTGSKRIAAGWHYNGWRGYQTITSNADIENNWVHIIATFDGSSKILTLYKNGIQLETATTLNGAPMGSSLFGYFIAAGWEGGVGPYGDYSIVNMYNKALSASEVTTNYNAVKSRFGL